MLKIKRTDSLSKDFHDLIGFLDSEILTLYPEIKPVYKAHSAVGNIKTVLLLYENYRAVACGCFISHQPQIAEIKRMFVLPQYRRKGYSKIILTELEKWAKELGHKTTVLETRKKQLAAADLYKNMGYKETKTSGSYKDLENSLSFKKEIS